jgi:chromosome segregation ATPase
MDPVTAALVLALIGPIAAYVLAARRLSGKIETSEAKDLWAESRSIRDWSQKRIEGLNDEITKLQLRVSILETSNEELIGENKRLAEQVRQLSATIIKLREEIVHLTEQLKASRNRVGELEDEKGA